MREDTRSVPKTLRIIHLAIAAWLFVIVAVLLLVLVPERGAAEGPEAGAGLARWIWLGSAVVAIFAAGVLRGRMGARGLTAERLQALAVTLWALAELQALVGVVVWLVFGDLVPAAIGLLVFLYLWVRHRPSTLPAPGSAAHGPVESGAAP